MFTNKKIHCSFCYNKIHVSTVYFLSVLVIIWSVFFATNTLYANKYILHSTTTNNNTNNNPTVLTNSNTYNTSINAVPDNLLCVFNKINKNSKITEKQRDEIIIAAINAERITGIDAALLLTLAYKESEFNLNAKSKKGYMSVMQTPAASKRWYSVDMLIGAEILKEKITLSKGNIKKAIAMYKGGANKPLSVMLASKVLSNYKIHKKECYKLTHSS